MKRGDVELCLHITISVFLTTGTIMAARLMGRRFGERRYEDAAGWAVSVAIGLMALADWLSRSAH